MLDDLQIFALMVFIAVFLLAVGLMVPTFGTDAQAAKRLRGRVKSVLESMDTSVVSLLREKYLNNLSPLERWAEALPGMEKLATLIEQSGRSMPAYRVVLLALVIAAGSVIAVTLWVHQPLAAILVAPCAFLIPFLKLRHDRAERLAQFEEQLPDALDMICRALRAGVPFTECLGLVGEEIAEPSAREFRTIFTNINYGMPVKTAFLGLLQRVPSLSFLAMVTAVLVQRETGGNLAEILGKVSIVLRGRFRFQRRVKSLSAEGRLSGWILALIPFCLAGMLFVVQPDYLPKLVKDPLGRQMIMAAFGFLIVGVFWIRSIIKIDF